MDVPPLPPLGEQLRAGATPGRWWLPTALLAVLALLVAPQDQALSTQVITWGKDAYDWRDLLVAPSWAGRGETLVVLALVLGGLGQRTLAWRLLVALSATALVVTALKYGVGRIRPNGGELSFPSGDAAAAAAMLVPLLRWRATRALGVLMAMIALGVALSRVLRDYHFPSDVFAGLAIGWSLGLVFSRLRRPRWLNFAARHWARAALWSVPVIMGCMVLFGDLDGQKKTLLFLALAGPAMVMALAAAHWRRRAWFTGGRILPRALEARPWLFLAALGLLLGFLATRSSLWDRDEARFAKATVEMIQSDNYLVPTFNGEERLHKPIMPYWLMSVPVRLLGMDELSVRLPAIVGALLAVLAVWWVGRRLLGPGQGLPAAMILAASPLLIVVGTAATADGALLGFITLAIAIWVAAWVPDRNGRTLPPWPAAVLMGLAMAAALLQKGPLGLLVPVLTVAVAWLLFRHERRFRSAHLIVAAGLALLVFLAWGIPANRATEGRFLMEGLFKHVGSRGLKPMESHGGGPWYYLPVVIVAFLPFTAFLPALIAGLSARRLGDARGRALLVAWFVPAFVVMSFYATKLPHYILPVFPALALGVAMLLRQLDEGITPTDRRWLRVGGWLAGTLVAIVGVALVLGVWVAQRVTDVVGLSAPVAGLGGGMLMALWVVHRAWRGERFRLAMVLMATASGVTILTLAMLLPSIEVLKPSRPMAAWIAVNHPDLPVATGTDFQEASLDFYLRLGVPERVAAGAITAWAAQPGTALLVTTRDELERAGDAPMNCTVLHQITGFNIANGKRVQLVAVARNLAR